MAKASKAFNKIGTGTPMFKPQFKKQDNGFQNYKPKQEHKKPTVSTSYKPKQKVVKPSGGVSVDKRLHTLFMSTKNYTLLFKIFSTTGGSDLPVFNKIVVRNTKSDKGENAFSYYFYDANYSRRIENWDHELEITDVIFYSDTNVKFVLKSGVSVVCEQIISKKFIDAKFQEFVMGKKPAVKG